MKFALPLVMAFGLILSACGQSPLLNHVNAGELNTNKVEAELAPGQCLLAFPKQKLCGNIFWSVAPKIGQPSAFRLQFHNMNTRKLQDPAGELQVELWMPSMGHGSSPVTITDTEAVGSFDVSNVYFIMGGEWDIRVRLITPEAGTEEAKTTVRL